MTELRPIRIEPYWNRWAAGSALIESGHTRVLTTVGIEERVPDWMRDSGRGWVTAEYSMLPHATHERERREVTRGKPSGRTTEIQRLLGRAFRAAVDLEALGERKLTVDCDVLQADGGTRCAALNGGIVALALACRRLLDEQRIERMPLKFLAAAVSVGRVDGIDRVDLDYGEDSAADLDLNVIITSDGRLIEISGGAEGEPFSEEDLTRLITLGRTAAEAVFARQRDVLKGIVEL